MKVANKFTYILDIGSSKICLLACRTNKSKPIEVTSVCGQYDGFMDGEFFDFTQVSNVIKDLINQIESRLKLKIDNVYVGVPSEFSACVCKRVMRDYEPSKRIDDSEISTMFDGVEDFGQKNEYEVISASPIQYEFDGQVSNSLNVKRVNHFVMDCSYILAKQSFINNIKQIFSECGIENIEFVSTALAEAQFISSNIDKPIVIVDIGHITTTVAVAKGEGLMMLSSFSLGGGHITADLMQVSNLTYPQADAIKHKVALTIQSKRDERYIAYVDNKPVNSLINITNNVVKARLENIANVINKVLDKSNEFKNLPIYLMGDGASNFRGIIDLFKNTTNREVKLIKSGLNNVKDKYQISKIGLANIIGKLV